MSQNTNLGIICAAPDHFFTLCSNNGSSGYFRYEGKTKYGLRKQNEKHATKAVGCTCFWTGRGTGLRSGPGFRVRLLRTLSLLLTFTGGTLISPGGGGYY